MAVRTLLNITLYVHCLSCLVLFYSIKHKHPALIPLPHCAHCQTISTEKLQLSPYLPFTQLCNVEVSLAN